MNVEMRKLNPNETYCCSIHEYKKFFKPSELHVSFGIQFSRDEKENSKFYHPKNNSNNIIINSLKHFRETEDSKRNILPGYKYEEIQSNKYDLTKTSNYKEFFNIISNTDNIDAKSNLIDIFSN